jgi:hypothetical protein
VVPARPQPCLGMRSARTPPVAQPSQNGLIDYYSGPQLSFPRTQNKSSHRRPDISVAFQIRRERGTRGGYVGGVRDAGLIGACCAAFCALRRGSSVRFLASVRRRTEIIPRIFHVSSGKFRVPSVEAYRDVVKPQTQVFFDPKKVRPAPGEEPAARTRSGDGEGWGRDRGRKLLVCFVRYARDQRDAAVAGVPRGSPNATHTFGSDCDCRLTKR